ncbi:hypothetical protein [Gemmata sp.]|uniref:hypothetical protein n=1 Tax=Gemmata sp. TaxID=1914242 RepID=UPI003F6E6C86
MATTVNDAAERHDFAPDILGVKSRVSWSAIFGGTVIALATYIVLTMLLGAIGITLTDAGVRGNAVGTGVLVAMIVTMVVALFLGGWVSSQLTAGENRQEAAIYGLLTWAAVTGATLMLVSMGVRGGYFAIVGGSMVAQNSDRGASWEETARQAGVPQQQIDSAKAAVDPNRVRAELNDPANQERAMNAAVTSSWVALVATMLSMAAAVTGAMAGRGAAFRLFPAGTGAGIRRSSSGPQLIVPNA